MAWYPNARRREIPPGDNDPVIIPVGIVLHVDAGNASSLYDYFNGPSGGIESHFHIQRDGDVEQYRSTTREADANYRGNSWRVGKGRHGLLSVETQGFEHGEWTDAQLASIKDLIRWTSREHNFPMQIAPTWQGPGVGYHVMFGAPGPWTPVAKSCPGPDRVRQFHDIITPWLESGGAMSQAGPEQWDNADWDAYKAHMDDYHQHRQIYPSPDGESLWSERHYRHWFGGRWREVRGQIAQVLANQRAIMQSQGVEVDEQALASEIAAVLVPAVVAEVSDATEDELEAVITRVVERLRVTVD